MKVRDTLGYLSGDGETTVKAIWKKQNMRVQMGSVWRQQRSVACCWKYEPLCSTKTAEILTSWAIISFSRRYPTNDITTCCIPCTGCAVLGTKLCGIRWATDAEGSQQSICGQKPTGVTGRGHQKDRYKPPLLATELCNSRLTNLMAATPIKLV